MRYTLSTLFVSLVLFSFSVHAQYFSGELTYSLKLTPKKPNISVDSMMDLEPGTSSTYLITEYYYKNIYYRAGKQTYSYTYHDQSKRMYDADANKEYITYRDSRKGNTSRIRSIVYKDSIKVIAGYTCFMVERVYESYIAKTYYAKDLKINPETYRAHEVGDWYNQIKEVDGCLSMGTISEYSTHTEEHLVSKVVQRSIKKEEFDLPKKTIAASYSALDELVKLDKPSEEALSCYRKKLEEAGKLNVKTKTVVYVGFIVSEKGAISYVNAIEPDENGLHRIAEDIINSCGLKFTPGKIAGEIVSALIYFPIEFNP